MDAGLGGRPFDGATNLVPERQGLDLGQLVHAGPMDVPIRDEMIRLGQFLKLSGAVDTGSDVKVILATDDVTVNGEVEHRRGRQLVKGDQVTLGDLQLRVI